MGIYVETLIHAPMDVIWAHTQQPDLHERWDLRFSTITYLPRPDTSQPQRFLYSTRIGFGLTISGQGESIADREIEDGSRVSSLRFSSSSPLSLIREGSGYWKYIPTDSGVRFLTWYDYRTRWGALGRWVDRLAFRPLIGWATAWSFDRLRRWVDRGQDPGLAIRQALIHAIARLSLAAILLYHGLVPKLLFPHPDERLMLRLGGLSESAADAMVPALGVVEVVLALALLITWRRPWFAWVCLGLMPVATLGVAMTAPRFLNAAFNPVTLNLGVASLAMIDLIAGRDLASASLCLRVPSEPPT